MFRRVLLLGMVLAGLLAGTAQAASWQSQSLRVMPSEMASWTSHQRFAPTQTVETAIYVDGKALANADSHCRSPEIGYGAVVIINVCGSTPVPLRIRASSLDGNPHNITINFRAIDGYYGQAPWTSTRRTRSFAVIDPLLALN